MTNLMVMVKNYYSAKKFIKGNVSNRKLEGYAFEYFYNGDIYER